MLLISYFWSPSQLLSMTVDPSRLLYISIPSCIRKISLTAHPQTTNELMNFNLSDHYITPSALSQ